MSRGVPKVVSVVNSETRSALTLSKDGFITPIDLPKEIAELVETPAQPALGLLDDRPTLEELSRRYIELILRETGGNKKRAAEILGIDRRTLYRTLEREGRDREGTPGSSDEDES